MNQSQNHSGVTFRIVADPNPWADAPTLPRLSPFGALLLCLFVTACAVYPTVAGGVYTLVMLATCATVYLSVVRAILPALAAFSLFALGCIAGGLDGGVLVLCLLCAVSIGAFVICTVRSWLLLAVPALSYIAALVLCGDAVLAVMALIAFPAAGILAYAVMQNSGRVGTICATSAMFGLCAVFGLALLWYRENGTVSWDKLMTLLTEVRDGLITELQQSDRLAALQQSLDDMGLNKSVDAAAFVRSTVEAAFTLLPAAAVTLCNLFGYAAQLSCTRAFAGTGMKQLMTRVSQLFILSVPTAIVFLVCTVATLFSNLTSLGGAVFANLFLILLPGMCLVGVFKLIADIRCRRSPWMIILIVATFLFATQFLILGLALSGAATTLLRPLLTRMMLSAHRQNKDDPSDKDE